MSGRIERKMVGGNAVEIIPYQGVHCDEYLMREVKSGRCSLFYKGILQLSWKEIDNKKSGGFTVYEKGKAIRSQDWDGLGGKEYRYMENSKNGLELVVEGSGVIYRGGFDNVESMKREGRGVEFDEKSGRVLRCGVWRNDELFQVIQEFESEDVMIEYEVDEGEENVSVLNRHPVYEGGYVFDEEKKEYVRHGEGCEIDVNTGCALREGKWETGKLVESMDLFDGWYVKMDKNDVLDWRRQMEIHNLTVEYSVGNENSVDIRGSISEHLSPVYNSYNNGEDGDHKDDDRNGEERNEMQENNSQVIQYSSITKAAEISKDCENIRFMKCPDLGGFLSFTQCSNSLLSVVIDDDSLNNATYVSFMSLNKLKSITIGSRSLTKATWLKIMNCGNLESLKIGPESFRNATILKVTDCSNLKSISVGDENALSTNFMTCNELVLSGE